MQEKMYNPMAGQPLAPARQSQVEQYTCTLVNNLSYLEERLGGLEVRLSSVVMPSCPKPDKFAQAVDEQVVPVAETLRSSGRRIADISLRIDSILERLEL